MRDCFMRLHADTVTAVADRVEPTLPDVIRVDQPYRSVASGLAAGMWPPRPMQTAEGSAV